MDGVDSQATARGGMNGRDRGTLPSLILITPAHNEEALLEKTIESVICQTVLPRKWVIVDDGSTDATAAIVSQYLPHCPWIEMVQRPPRRDRNFSGKVHAFNAGYEKVKELEYEVIGNLDADVSFEPDYLEFLLGKFAEDQKLGVAGTIFVEEGYSSERNSFEGHYHVAGGCQLFRKRCFDEISGFKPNRGGGVDWVAVTTARMMGWRTKSFREKSFFHSRHLGTAARGTLAAMFDYGERDYYLGGHPVWELFRVVYRMVRRPYVVAGFSLGLGYGWAMMRRIDRSVSRELMAFHRQEQMHKLGIIIKTLLTFKRMDSFKILPD